MTQQNVALRGKVDTVRAALIAMQGEFKAALPKHLTVERLMRVTMTAVQNNPKLLDCDRSSLYAAVMTAAQLGLETDGMLGQAYLVPYGKRVQFIPGYTGLLLLARNSGEISTIQTHAVHENDTFTFSYGLKETLEHIPAMGERGEITHFYAYAIYKDGGHIFEVMSKADVNAIRDNSDGYKAFKADKIRSNPWDSHYEQMGRKTVIRRLANYLPLNVQKAAMIDSSADAGKSANIDKLGEFVIESHAEAVAKTEEQTGASDATQRLDQLAGDGAQEPAKGNMVGDPPDLTKTPDDDKQPTMTELIKAIEAADSVDIVTEQIDLARNIKRLDYRGRVHDAGRKRMAELLPPADVDTRTRRDPAAANEDGGGLFGD